MIKLNLLRPKFRGVKYHIYCITYIPAGAIYSVYAIFKTKDNFVEMIKKRFLDKIDESWARDNDFTDDEINKINKRYDLLVQNGWIV